MKRKSAILPYKKTDEGIEVLLVRNMTNSKWVIPKGTVEFPLPPSLSATREAFEEAGVLGRTLPIDIGQYYKNGQKVSTYLLKVDRVLDAYDERTIRERKWVRVIDVHDYLIDRDLLEVVLSGVKAINRKGIFFKKMIKTFSSEIDIQILELSGTQAVIEFLPAADHTHQVIVSRYKKRIEFYISSELISQTLKEIDPKIIIEKLMDNARGEDGFWGMRKTTRGYELGRLLSFPMRLLNSTNFESILKSLVSTCDCFTKEAKESYLVDLDTSAQ